MNEAVSIIIPVHNGEHTIRRVLDSLKSQRSSGRIRIIVINDCSTDGTENICRNHPLFRKCNFVIKNNAKNKGLAASYNEGINLAESDIIVFLHQDCVLADKQCLERLVSPLRNPDVVASYCTMSLPDSVWQTYSFWGKVMFSRFVGKDISNLAGKFDAFRKKIILKLGGVDDTTFRVAGEDGDLKLKLVNYGKIKSSGAKIYHLHEAGRETTVKTIFRKEMQLGEAHGVLFRRYKFKMDTPKDILLILSKPAMGLGCFIPYLQLLSIPLLLIFSFVYSWEVFLCKDYRVIFVPIINITSLYLFTIGFIKGFVTKKQSL